MQFARCRILLWEGTSVCYFQLIGKAKEKELSGKCKIEKTVWFNSKVEQDEYIKLYTAGAWETDGSTHICEFEKVN